MYSALLLVSLITRKINTDYSSTHMNNRKDICTFKVLPSKPDDS